MHIGHAVGAAQPLPVDDRVALGDARARGPRRAGLLAAGEQRLGLGQHPAAGHLLGVAGEPCRLVDAGWATKVPRPGIRSSSPSATRASIAWRTVIRATPNCWHELALGRRRGARGRPATRDADVLAHLHVLERPRRAASHSVRSPEPHS